MRTIFVCALLAATSANAEQTSGELTANPQVQNDQQWDRSIHFELGPRLGESLRPGTDEDPVDESELGAYLKFVRPDVFASQPIAFRLGATYSPQWLDDTDPTGGFYGEVVLGDDPIPLFRLSLRDGSGFATQVEDTIRPYASYRFTSVHQDFVGDWARDEHRAVLGVRFRDVQTIMCDVAGTTTANSTACSNIPGIYAEARIELVQTWSTDAGYTRTAPTVRLDVVSRPIAGAIRFFGRAQGEAAFYSSVRVAPLGPKREDWRIRVTAGLDLSGLAARLNDGITLEAAVQFQQRWSNDPGREHTRAYFVPALSMKSSF